MDVKTPSCAYKNPVNKSCYLNVNSKLFGRNAMNVDTMLCAYKIPDVILTSFQQFLNVMDVRWTLGQCCVITSRLQGLRSDQKVRIPYHLDHLNIRTIDSFLQWSVKYIVTDMERCSFVLYYDQNFIM